MSSKFLILVLCVYSIDCKSVLNRTQNINIFELPTKIEHEDILETYGSFMLQTMNKSVNPCEDFYEFSCGNWKNVPQVPEKLRNDTFLHAINTQVNILISDFLSEKLDMQSLNDSETQTAELKAKIFYQSCMNMSENLDQGYQHLLQMSEFQQKNDSDNWININFMSSNEMYALLPLTTNYNSETLKIELLLSPPRIVLGNKDLVPVQNLTVDFKINNETEKTEFIQEFEQAKEFEAQLVSRITARAANETERLSLNEFILRYSGDKLNWTYFFETAFNGTQQGDWIVQSKLQDTRNLAHFLNKTEPQLLRNYIKWRTLLKFYYTWKPVGTNKTQQEHCREQTETYYNYALVPWLITEIYDAERRADILQVAGNIKTVFYNFIDKHKWLDEETRSMAKTKLRTMDVRAGYTDELSHREYMNSAYKDVLMSTNWWQNVLVLEMNRARVRIKSINQALIPPPMLIKSANAYYANFLNEAYVAIGISQFPFYHRTFPAALKYGGIGHIIGHEIAHAFDSVCYQFNYDGKVRNWWTEASLRNFRERYRCLETQYNKFIYQGVATNGSLTLGDNIADNVGVRLAYYAYLQKMDAREADMKPLPNVQYNNRQLFFLRFAQTWCTGQDSSKNLARMKTDVHAYEKFRVVGTLRNMPEFSEVFQCKLGSNMNPLKKCVVW